MEKAAEVSQQQRLPFADFGCLSLPLGVFFLPLAVAIGCPHNLLACCTSARVVRGLHLLWRGGGPAVNGARLMLGVLLGVLLWGLGCCSTAATARMVEGRGVGLPAANAGTPDQQRMTACRAAYLAALADLAGKVYGTQVQADAKVVNMQFAGESVEAAVTGLVEGVEVISNTYDPQSGMAAAVVRVVLDARRRAPAPAQ
jgi:hypothetical protein